MTSGQSGGPKEHTKYVQASCCSIISSSPFFPLPLSFLLRLLLVLFPSSSFFVLYLTNDILSSTFLLSTLYLLQVKSAAEHQRLARMLDEHDDGASTLLSSHGQASQSLHSKHRSKHRKRARTKKQKKIKKKQFLRIAHLAEEDEIVEQ